MKTRLKSRIKRKLRIRAKVSGTLSRPRMVVFRSHRGLNLQLIDDSEGKTLLSGWVKGKNQQAAKILGAQVAEAAKAKKIKTVVFDRAGFRFHGVIKTLADAAREGGLKF